MLLTKYYYDGLNRLIREDNYESNEAYTWTYDVGGNIREKCTYCLASDGSIGSCQKHDTYTYASSGWKDQLTYYNGQSIVYDALGNPTTYRGKNLTWTNVRRLASYGSNTFAYGADGIRYKKNNITYTLDGNRIIKETDGASRNITYYYGIDGVIGFNYNGLDFYYRKNLQGDVIAIYSACGTLAATYAYDAWGNVIAGSDYSGMNIRAINPFRYRSYYYDTETGLYYLNSRYYDPETGRFINADDTQYLEPEVLDGINLYAYCGNNPVMGYDPEGTWDWGRIGKALVIAVAVVAVVAAIAVTAGAATGAVAVVANVATAATVGAGVELFDQAVIENKSFSEVNWTDVGIAAVSEGVGAFVPGSGVCTMIGSSIVSSAVSCIGNNLFTNNEKKGLTDFAIDAFGNIACSFIGQGITKIGHNATSKLFGGHCKNYSQYQHWLRQQGLDLSRNDAYDRMIQDMANIKSMDFYYDNSGSFLLGVMKAAIPN